MTSKKQSIPVASSFFLSRVFNLMRINNDPIKFFDQCIQKNGNLFKVEFPGFEFNYLLEPEGIQYVLEKNHINFKKSIVYDPLKLAVGNGLLTSDGAFWKSQRKTIQPLFNTNFIKEICHDISVSTDEFFLSLGDGPLDLNKELANLTIDIACRAFFATSEVHFSEFISAKTNQINEFMNQRILMPFIPMWFPLPSHFKFNRSIGEINERIKALIVLAGQNDSRPSLLSMLANSKSISDETIRDEVLTFLIAGHETTTNALSFLLYLLSKYPDVKQAVKEEVALNVTEEHPNYESLQTLTYTKAVINEALRLFPPAWIISREALEDDEIMGCFLPKQSVINIPTFLVQRHEAFWDAPNEFNPDRFVGDQNRHKFSFLPFGGGPRFCIGMQFAYTEMLIFLVKLFRFSDFKVLNNDVDLEFLVTLRPKNQLLFELSKRTSS
ncbi:MAG: cytochrome P450 [Candidatus Margulisiibacteriota bacterium]|nr:cytochrome P450 [Candidatus Margulisiibacteriota bacterium]